MEEMEEKKILETDKEKAERLSREHREREAARAGFQSEPVKEPNVG